MADPYEYEANDGRTITIEPNDDGSFSVSDDEGRWVHYGGDVAGNIYQDWNLRGVDLADAGVPEEPDPIGPQDP